MEGRSDLLCSSRPSRVVQPGQSLLRSPMYEHLSLQNRWVKGWSEARILHASYYIFIFHDFFPKTCSVLANENPPAVWEPQPFLTSWCASIESLVREDAGAGDGTLTASHLEETSWIKSEAKNIYKSKITFCI